MARIFTTEITSEKIPSDNPIHQRLLKAYVVARDHIRGDVLEVGCGEGRGIDFILPMARTYTAIDKLENVIDELRARYPSGKFFSGNIPPLDLFATASFDVVISFQVIEHIADDQTFLNEIARVLRPGGLMILTTPNRPKSLTRNPWHIREYTASELGAEVAKSFSEVRVKGIAGNTRVMEYYDRNKKAVERLMRWDIFDLQHRLPAAVLQVPYEWMNRWNRNKLQRSSDQLVTGITVEDYTVTERGEDGLDLLVFAKK